MEDAYFSIEYVRARAYGNFARGRMATKEDLLVALQVLNARLNREEAKIVKNSNLDLREGPGQIPGYDEEKHGAIFDYAYAACLASVSEKLNSMFGDFGGLSAFLPQNPSLSTT